jgi:serine protein kinase
MKSLDINQFVSQYYSPQDFSHLYWSGTLQDYVDLVSANPLIARNSFQRIHDMIMSFGTSKYTEYKKEIVRYHFFDDPIGNGKDGIFGIDVHLMKFVNFFKSAAAGYGTEKRILLLHGPVGSAKSSIARLMKKGIEYYSKRDDGSLYTYEWFDDSASEILGGAKIFHVPMHEEPLKLLPHEPRTKFLEELSKKVPNIKLRVKGELNPACRYIFEQYMKQYKGDWTKVMKHIRVKRLILSEKDRVGVGTFQPKDEKNQDSTELTGDINYRKIAIYGSDSDPRAFNFDGEFNIANRGMVEFIEMLKLDVAFLYDLLGASQEQSIKPKKFAQTDIDEVILGHTNEPEFKKLQNNEFMEALRDRTVKIDVPYITRLDQEVKIYQKDFNKNTLPVHIAPIP